MANLDHARLGNLKGISKDGVLTFRGLKFASLEHGFAEPKVSVVQTGHVDATRYGPAAIHPLIGCDLEHSLIQKSLPHDPITSSITDCLNLNISIPEKRNVPLPVFVFFHGGGFRIGSNSWPQYDLARVIKLSQDLNKPVVGVGVNYRLGIYGFLDSTTLRQAGIKANRGLRDQRAALEWVRQNIAGFGGDPDQVTVIGESAGGVSCTLHLQSREPLFNQLVSMGGTSLLMKPLPPQIADVTYSSVLKIVGVNDAMTPKEQLKGLLNVNPETFLSSVGPDVPLLPIIDGDIITSKVTFAQWTGSDSSGSVPGTAWCRRVMLGDCQNDAMIMTSALRPRRDGIAAAFKDTVTKYLSTQQSDLTPIYNGYNITSDIPDDEALLNILKYIHDIGFYAPTRILSQGWPKSAFLYHFNEPNPWEGPFKGQATHVLDVVFLFQNFNEYLDPEQVASAQHFGRDFITFVNGEEPYPVHDPNAGGAQVYGPHDQAGGTFVQSQHPVDYGRRALVWDLAKQYDWDDLSLSVDMILAGQ
ncbi:Alpha/Beta hydrolase protein [Xylariales sp. AK1849]|nr:Alpha/Beta hydrolase protein [Xylariales sp. AK1849]